MAASSLTIPAHIAAAGIAGRSIDFEWDDNNIRQYYCGESNERLNNKIRPLSPRGKLALSAGIAEWVIWRFHGLSDFTDALDYVTAVWAAVIDSRYLSGWRLPEHGTWVGPALEPQWIVAHALGRVFGVGQQRWSNTYEVGYLASVAHHIVGRHEAYRAWLEAAMERLTKLSLIPESTRAFYKTIRHTRAEVDAFDWGAPVPRAALDTTYEYDVARAPADLDAYLRGLDPARNPYLATREELIAKGFEGTPYTYPRRLA